MRKILFVDDEPNILEGLERMLFPMQQEWCIVFASGGQEALDLMKKGAEQDLGFARVDLERKNRRGMPEVIFAEGKTAEQVVKIVASLKDAGQNALCTRASRDLFDAVVASHPEAEYNDAARMIIARFTPTPELTGLVSIVSTEGFGPTDPSPSLIVPADGRGQLGKGQTVVGIE